MKIGTQVLAALLAVGAIYFYGSCRERAGAKNERLVAQQRAVEDSTRWADSLEAERRRADSVAHVYEIDTSRRSVDFRRRARQMERRADSLISLVPDPLLRDSLDKAFADALAAKDSLFANSERRAALFYARWQAADSSARRFQGLAESWRRQAEVWQKKSRPGILEQARRALPWMLAGVVLWEVAR